MESFSEMTEQLSGLAPQSSPSLPGLSSLPKFPDRCKLLRMSASYPFCTDVRNRVTEMPKLCYVDCLTLGYFLDDNKDFVEIRFPDLCKMMGYKTRVPAELEKRIWSSFDSGIEVVLTPIAEAEDEAEAEVEADDLDM
jgi:hypothetical protein